MSQCCRTPITIAKKERVAKFLCDLVLDQDHKNLLLAESDYGIASHTVNEEIASLCPISKEEEKTQILNEWNANDLLSDSEEDEEERDNSVSSEDYDGAPTDNSFQTACWGRLSDKELVLTDESEITIECQKNVTDKESKDSNMNTTMYAEAPDATEQYHEAKEGEVATSTNLKFSVSTISHYHLL